jgi:hypothetical protein
MGVKECGHAQCDSPRMYYNEEKAAAAAWAVETRGMTPVGIVDGHAEQIEGSCGWNGEVGMCYYRVTGCPLSSWRFLVASVTSKKEILRKGRVDAPFR